MITAKHTLFLGILYILQQYCFVDQLCVCVCVFTLTFYNNITFLVYAYRERTQQLSRILLKMEILE